MEINNKSNMGDNHKGILQRFSKNERILSLNEEAVCGAISGLATRLIIGPFDVVKISMQLENSKMTIGGISNSRISRCVSKIFLKEGMRGFYKGNISAAMLYSTYGAAQFYSISMVERVFEKRKIKGDTVKYLLGGGVAGCFATIVSYPFDLLRTRFSGQWLEDRAYKGYRTAIGEILKEEGVRGFYKGLPAALTQVFPYMGLMFYSYNIISEYLKEMEGNAIAKQTIVGGAAGAISKFLVYPLDLIRKRRQVQCSKLTKFGNRELPEYKGGMFVMGREIVRKEGVLGLFRGVGPSLIKAGPSSGVLFFMMGVTHNLVLLINKV